MELRGDVDVGAVSGGGTVPGGTVGVVGTNCLGEGSVHLALLEAGRGLVHGGTDQWVPNRHDITGDGEQTSSFRFVPRRRVHTEGGSCLPDGGDASRGVGGGNEQQRLHL
ncbi:hypothetical protein GCM10027080_36060 [Pedococcus soli]